MITVGFVGVFTSYIPPQVSVFLWCDLAGVTLGLIHLTRKGFIRTAVLFSHFETLLWVMSFIRVLSQKLLPAGFQHLLGRWREWFLSLISPSRSVCLNASEAGVPTRCLFLWRYSTFPWRGFPDGFGITEATNCAFTRHLFTAIASRRLQNVLPLAEENTSMSSILDRRLWDFSLHNFPKNNH